MHDIYLIYNISDLLAKKSLFQLVNNFYSMQALYQKFEIHHIPLVIFYQASYSYCKIMMHNYISFFLPLQLDILKPNSEEYDLKKLK